MRKTFHYLGKIIFKISLSMLDKDGDGKIEVEEILSSALEITKLSR